MSQNASKTTATKISKESGTFKSFDGTEIYYECRGSGRPLILCYGLACLMNHWNHQIKHFSENYRVITFDYRGHHKSAAPMDSKNLSLDALVEDIRCLTEHLKIKQASFWGHSYGVQLLLRYFDLYPQTVKNFVFINGFAKNPIKGMFGTVLGPETITKVFHAFQAAYRQAPQPIGAAWKLAVTNPAAVPLAALAGGFNLNTISFKDIEVYARGVASLDVDLFLRLFEEMMDYDGTAVLAKINVPTLIISGKKDGVTPASYQYEMHNLILNSELCEIPYGSHCTQLDFPEFTNLRVDKFLASSLYS